VVADLASRLAVEGRAVEDDLALLADVEARRQGAVLEHREDPRVLDEEPS
jgi:hypothetical protein